jgi:cytochrome P450
VSGRLNGRSPQPPWLDEEFLTPEFFVNPYRLYGRLLDDAPVAWSEKARAWLVCGFDDVVAGLSDDRLSSGRRIPALASALSPEARERDARALDCMALMMAFRDPPAHTRLRKIVSRAFTARRVADLERQVQELVDTLVDQFPRGDAFDLVAALTFPLPALVICRLLGIPEERLTDVRRWSDAVVALLSSAVMTDDHADQARVAVEEADAYIRSLVDARRAEPQDDLLTAIARTGVDGDSLSPDEITAMVILLFFAGFETTEGLIGNGVLALLADDGLRKSLAADPELAPAVVEEVLRFDTSVHRQSRIAVTPLTISGVDIEEGDPVLFMIGAAGRDPRRFRRPDRFDPHRLDAGNVGFGHGFHFCLGAPLARLETRIALATLAKGRYPLHSAGQPTYGTLLAVRKPSALPVTLA